MTSGTRIFLGIRRVAGYVIILMVALYAVMVLFPSYYSGLYQYSPS